MCGIAGLVDFSRPSPERVETLAANAARRIAPRGPDGHGFWRDEHCALVHARLAIIDLTEGGAQPMRRGDLAITYNGEIFNYRDVKSALAALGHRFTSGSDTEVILAGWQEWGPDLLPRLNGMFAFALWDAASRTLWAARDRFGEKPFLYAHAGPRLAFGSDLLACEAMLGEQRPVDPAALRALFELRFVPEPMSIAQGVAKLGAGHLLRLDASGLSVAPWYRLRPTGRATDASEPDTDAALRERFDAAVMDRLVSDVPVGVFLSGGIDSALVAASVAASGVRPRTFTVGFDGASSYFEERPLAAAVARHIGADHTEIAVPQERAFDVLDRVFTGLDEPFADASAVPTFLVSEVTRRKVTVVLTGDGADEVFGGYRRYWGELYADKWNALPSPVRDLIRSIFRRLPEGKDSRLLETVRRARRFVDTASVDPVRRQAGWMREVSGNELNGLLGPKPSGALDVEAFISAARQPWADVDGIAQMLAADVSIGLPSDMLVKVDRMSMANALETRAPFLDPRVVEFAFALPPQEKLWLDGFRPQGKRILRRAFKDRLPAEVFQRPKRGFEMPVRALLEGAARERLERAADPTRLARQGLFDPGVVAGWRRDLASGRRDTSWSLWTLLAFQEWARLHGRPEAA